MGMVTFLFVVGILEVTGSSLHGKDVRYVLDGSTCEPQNIKTETMDNIFLLKSSGDELTNGTSTGRQCVSNITFHGSLYDKGMKVDFLKEVSTFFDVSVIYHPLDKRSVNNLFPTGRWDQCLTSPDHVIRLEINYSLKKDYAGNITTEFFKTTGVGTCLVESIESTEDKPFLQEDQPEGIGGSGEPKVGTVKTTKVAEQKAPLDVIIIAGVGVAAVVGIALSVFAIRRWIRNNAAEERRQSVIRVNSNSQGSITRSTSNSMQSTTRTALHSEQHSGTRGRGYGTVIIGGRLPSSEDDSDLFPDDTKSVKTVLEYD